MKKRLLYITAAGVVALLGFLYLRPLEISQERPEYKQRKIQDVGFWIEDIDEFVTTAELGGEKDLSITGKKEETVLRVRVLSEQTPELSERYTKGQSILLEAQYDTRLPPYPEFLTNKTGCAARFLPRRVDGPLGPIYLVHGDERFNYGLCSDDLLKYKAGLGIFYCAGTRKTFQVEYFTGLEDSFEDIEAFMRSFECENT